MSQPSVYLDHAATTPVRPEVVAAMLPFFTDIPGNPSSLHAFGRAARRAVGAARDQVAAFIGGQPAEVIFTSGGTEADNLAIRGVVAAARGPRPHVVTTAVEHHAVLDTCHDLAGGGADVTVLGVDQYGQVDPAAVAAALRPETVLVSVMVANNEVGTVQPLAAVAAQAHQAGVLVHADAVAALGKLPVNVADLGVDLLSGSAHKIYGPKGVGFLWVRRGVRLVPVLTGGSQEARVRPGTENVPGIVGLGQAAALAAADLATETARLAALRDRLVAGLAAAIPGVVQNGHPKQRAPHIANLSFPGAAAESLLVAMDLLGIAASAGSACTAGAVEPSHVLAAMGLARQRLFGAVRFSLGRGTTGGDVDYVVATLPALVGRLRREQPVAPD